MTFVVNFLTPRESFILAFITQKRPEIKDNSHRRPILDWDFGLNMTKMRFQATEQATNYRVLRFHPMCSIPSCENVVSTPILNIAAYKFVPLDGLTQRRRELKGRCESLKLKGTILLSPEGINIFLAGRAGDLRSFLEFLRSDPAFEGLEVKESYSEKIPFRRMLVRLKKEIISFGIDSVRPMERTSPKLPAAELKRWLDEGRPIRLLDTRNDYEVDLGTFHGAEHLQIGHFRQFPDAISKLPAEAKREPLVMFCTGGIRCEKAGPLMEQAGFEQVYQLEGGILKYFEECGGAHYDGSCFVFDGRVALDPALQPTGNLLCFACQHVLTPEEVTSEKFVFGQHCPHCYLPPLEQEHIKFERRSALIKNLAATQPGCTPYDNVRQIHVAGKFAGNSMIDFLDAYQPAIGRTQWLEWLNAGMIRRRQIHNEPRRAEVGIPDHVVQPVVQGHELVREGDCFEQHMPDTIEPRINANIQLLFEDAGLVVVNKPAPLPSHPSGRFNRNTLLNLLAPAYPNEKLRVAHRLDANTSGVVVLCRKHQSARFVQPQFSQQQVKKIYIAKVHGHPKWDTHVCCESISREPNQHGLRVICDSADGDAAETRLRVIERLPDGTSLIEARPISGRTNQIRLHLWHLEHAVVGDPLYLQNRQFGSVATLDVDSPPMCLHAYALTFIHPDTRQLVTYSAELPTWCAPITVANVPSV